MNRMWCGLKTGRRPHRERSGLKTVALLSFGKIRLTDLGLETRALSVPRLFRNGSKLLPEMTAKWVVTVPTAGGRVHVYLRETFRSRTARRRATSDRRSLGASRRRSPPLALGVRHCQLATSKEVCYGKDVSGR